MATDRRATRLSAVPDVPEGDHGDVPDDWRELRASFVLALRAAKRSPLTIRTYLDGVDGFARWLGETVPGRLVEESTRSDLRGYLVSLSDRGLSDNTVGARHRALRALYKFMLTDEIITTNPMADIPVPQIREERVPQALEQEQIDAMVRGCRPKSTLIGSRDRALVTLISSSGIRASECLGLTESDLHLDEEQPYVTVLGKGNKFREAACSYEAAAAIAAYLRQRRKHRAAHRRELWLSRAGTALSVSGLRQIVADAGQRVGIEGLYTHALRHSAVHGMLARGMSDSDVQVQAGWTSAKQLQRYGAAKKVERSRAAFFRSSDG
jgi:integrase/recombinase XerD